MNSGAFFLTLLGLSATVSADLLGVILPTIPTSLPPLFSNTTPPASPADCGTGTIADGPNYGICGYDQTGNILSEGAARLSNVFFPYGNCYCRTDCYPSQITCRRDSLAGMTAEQLAIIAYIAEMYYGHCYCANQPEPYCPKTRLIFDSDICPDHPDSPYVLLDKFRIKN